MKRLTALLIIVLIAGCKSSSDMKLETAARIYVQNLVVDEKYRDKPDSAAIMHDKIYSKFNLSKEEYKKVFDGIMTDKERWDVFFTLSEKYLDSLKNNSNII